MKGAMKPKELLRSPVFDVVLEEILHLVEPVDGGTLSAHIGARDGVLTVTVPFMYGIGVRVGAHYVGNTYGEATVELTELVDCVRRNRVLPSSSSSSDEILVAPLTGWTRVASIHKNMLDRHLEGVDRRMMETLDRCTIAAMSASAQGPDAEPDPVHEEREVARTLARPVDMWDMGDGTSVCLPGSFLFAAAVLGHLDHDAVLFEQGRWLCLSTGGVEYISAAGGSNWRIPIDP
jgi:hypothetical protein